MSKIRIFIIAIMLFMNMSAISQSPWMEGWFSLKI